jgi:hypothetical protein
VYEAEKDRIEREYKAEKERCDSLAENAKDICLVEVKGREEVARADLEAKYEPSKENRYKVRATQAEADYAVAKERCDDQAGNVKDICLKEAKAAEAAAKANARRANWKQLKGNAAKGVVRGKRRRSGCKVRNDCKLPQL